MLEARQTISFSKRKVKDLERRDELSVLETEVKRLQELFDESPTPENLTGLEETHIRYGPAYDYVDVRYYYSTSGPIV